MIRFNLRAWLMLAAALLLAACASKPMLRRNPSSR